MNTNGILSFRSQYLQYFPEMFPCTGLPLIAPFWNDIDITTSGNIFYRTPSNVALLQRAHDQLQELFPSSGNFTPTTVFIATWDRVAQFGRRTQVRFCIHDNLLLLVYLEWGSACMHVTLNSCCGTAWRGTGIMVHYYTSRQHSEFIANVTKQLILIRNCIIFTGKHIPGCNCSRSADDICVLHIWRNSMG